MVPGEADPRLLGDEPAAGVRARAVTDDVAEAPDLVGTVFRDRVENSLEGV